MDYYYDVLQSMSLVSVIDLVMRIPPLFVIDELLRIDLGLPSKDSALGQVLADQQFGNVSETFVANATSSSFLDCDGCDSYAMMTLVLLANVTVCLAALVMFMLETKHLLTVYVYLISFGTIFVSYWANIAMMKVVLSFAEKHNTTTVLENILNLNIGQILEFKPGITVFQNVVLQTMMGFYFCNTHLDCKGSFIQNLVLTSFLFPSSFALYHKLAPYQQISAVFAAFLQLVIFKFDLWKCFSEIKDILYYGYRYARTFISNYGLSPLIETEWSRLKVPRVLRVFWLLRVAEQLIRMLNTHYYEETFAYYTMLRNLLVNGCETLPALLGMTSVVSFMCHYIGCFFQWVLLTDDEDEKSFGTISAVLFYILALQTGLTGLDHEKRFVRLCKNFCLLVTAVLHFVHNLVNPLLMSLSASHNPALHRHLRALAVCGFLIVFASSLLGFLWTHFTISTWLFAVSVFSIEVIVKVLVSLAIYSLFLFVAYRSTFWEQLDDCVYFIRSFGNTVEFAFGIMLFINGSWILLFESGGAIRAVMMCIHAYFNLWCEARAGWNVFMKRRSAVAKINSLPEAEAEQLRSHDDVCAICYQEMCHAKITKCNHFFHAVCLRKWLYVQDRCPLCHDILYKVETPEKTSESANLQEPVQVDEQVDDWLADR